MSARSVARAALTALLVTCMACGGDDDGGAGIDAAATDGGPVADGGGDAGPTVDAAVPNLGAFRFTWTIDGDATCASVGASVVSVGFTRPVGPTFLEQYACDDGQALSDTYPLSGSFELSPSLDADAQVIATLPSITKDFATCDDVVQQGGATVCVVFVPLAFVTGGGL